MRNSILPLLVAGVMALGASQSEQGTRSANNRSPEQRAAELVSKMSLAEKVSQMQDQAPAIPRLGIPAYGWWNEALHGVARNGLATVFPQAIGLAATWDTDLEFRIADVISTEARAKYNLAIQNDEHGRYQGLTFWSPNINIFRDPRWGRGQETFGEDPYLTAQMARQFIRGMQGSDPRFFKTIATSKHFAVHSGPETGRHSFDAQVSEDDLEHTYLRAFRATLGSNGAYSAMCAYNRVNGAPACASTDLLQKHLRGAWGFPGYVVSDCGAIDDIYRGHHFAGTIAEATAKAVKAGTDLDCGTEYRHLTEAVEQGLISEAEIDKSVTRLMAARIRLGLFDPPEANPFNKLDSSEIASPAHAQLALEAAEKSLVLLKNDGVLPWSKAPHRLAVIGPAADDPDTLLGNYYGTPPHIITPLAGIQKQFAPGTRVNFALGSVFAQNSTALIPADNFSGGLKAEYFNTPDLSETPALSRTEPRVYFHWGMAEPAVRNVLPKPVFSARWTGKLRASISGDYKIGVAHQECDSCPGNVTTRLLFAGQPIVNETRKSAGGAGSATAPVHLNAGQTYDVQLEYQQQGGGSGVELVWTPPEAPLLEEAVAAAKASDAVVLCLGLNSRLEGEESRVKIPGFSGGDRTDLNLPAGQEKLLAAILAAGKPVTVVLLNGSALAVNVAAARANALIEAWYPGQEGGTAIARTLAGENNPAGRLPVTFYQSVDQLPAFDDYRMQGRTYRYFSGKPLFPFGYGLSYSKFKYEKLPSEGNICRARITNISQRDGDEVAQLYRMNDGHWELSGFQRLHLRAGENRVVTFTSDTPSEATARWEIAGGLPAESKGTNAPRP